MKTIGFIGLGVLGKPMAGNVRKAGYDIKDLANALDTAHELGVPIPLSSQVMEIMQALKVDGKAAGDHGGLIQFYEKLARVEVRK
jgi:2-hydroxy-3-oxopropionate reductase